MQKRTPRIVVTIGVLLFWAGVAGAQTEPIAAAGSRIRVTLSPTADARPHRVVGRFTSDEPGTIVLTPDGQLSPLPIRKATITTIGRSAGRASRWRGAMFGALLGAGVGAPPAT